MTAIGKTEQTTDPEFIVLYDVPPTAYKQILEALGEFHLRHTYDQGTLEMRRVLYGVPPESYRQLLEALPEHHLRHTYDGWTLEMMSPRKDHDWVAELLGRMIETMAFVLDIPIQSIGSTTLTTESFERGLQPDSAYYVSNEPRVRGKDTYEPGKDPPPDLVIEVDVTHSSAPRLPLFAKLGVPEMWRHDRRQMWFYRLDQKGEYEEVGRSVAFPFVAPQDVTRFLDQRHDLDEHSVVRGFVRWAQEAYRQHKQS